MCINPGLACKGATGTFADISLHVSEGAAQWSAADRVRVTSIRWDASGAARGRNGTEMRT